eukprot:4817348-Amphidinium_carterae.1
MPNLSENMGTIGVGVSKSSTQPLQFAIEDFFNNCCCYGVRTLPDLLGSMYLGSILSIEERCELPGLVGWACTGCTTWYCDTALVAAAVEHVSLAVAASLKDANEFDSEPAWVISAQLDATEGVLAICTCAEEKLSTRTGEDLQAGADSKPPLDVKSCNALQAGSAAVHTEELTSKETEKEVLSAIL